MTTEIQLEQLEKAIRKRAQNLAETHFRTAQQQREQILAEATKRLRLREERETELAKAAAEQEYRRRVQAREIKMQAELDQLRWSLIQLVMTEVREHLTTLNHHPTEYKALLKQYLANAISCFTETELVVEVNAHDYALLSSQWPETITNLTDKQCPLTVSAQHFMGGLLVRDRADQIRIDNTFEGLMERLEGELYQVITSQLFATVTPTRNI